MGDTNLALEFDTRQIIEDARQKVKAMVRAASISRMEAYEIVGQRIGRSRDWVRAFCAGSHNAKIDVTVFNIDAAYRQSARGRE